MEYVKESLSKEELKNMTMEEVLELYNEVEQFIDFLDESVLVVGEENE